MALIKRNLNTLDRMIRLLVAAVCIYFGFVRPESLHNDLIAIFVGVFGLANLWAFAVASCPIYSLMGLSTCNDKHQHRGVG